MNVTAFSKEESVEVCLNTGITQSVDSFFILKSFNFLSLTSERNNVSSIHFLLMNLRFLASIVTFLRILIDCQRSFFTVCDPTDLFRSLWAPVKFLLIRMKANSPKIAVHRFIFSKDKLVKKMAFNIDLK
jgi:hypothetical protein